MTKSSGVREYAGYELGSEVELRNGGGREWIEVMAPAIELAQHVVNTEFVPKALRGNGAGIVAAILYGDELGLGPMQSLAKIAVVDGRPTLFAEAQRALILAAGHEIWVEEATTSKVTVSGRRSGSDRTSSITWTLDDAKRAGIAGKPSWRSYPRQMLTARATAELARVIFADVIGGLAATEEIDDVDPLSDSPIEPVKASRPSSRRKRKDVAAPAEASEPPASPAEPEAPPLPDESADSLTDRPASPLDEDLDIGADPAVGVENEGEETASVQEASTGSPAPEEVLEPASDSPSEKQLRALNALVGRLRETEVEVADGTKTRVLSTEQLWAATARRRNVEVDTMIALLNGRDDAGELHWSPLRDSLTGVEASDLIGKLEDRAQRWEVK